MKRWHWIGLGLLTILSLVAEFTLVKHHGSHWWNHIPGFYLLWGFIGSAAAIYISYGLGKIFLEREEHYYDQ